MHGMRRFLICVATVASGAPGLAHAAPSGPDADPICEAIRSFANATSDGQAHSITIYSQLPYEEFGRSGDVIWPLTSRRCQDDGTPEGAALCDAILSHVSYEFPSSAGTRAVACLSGQPYQVPQGVAVLDFSVAVRTFEMTGVKPGTQVDAEYKSVQGTTSHVGIFRLFAARKMPD